MADKRDASWQSILVVGDEMMENETAESEVMERMDVDKIEQALNNPKVGEMLGEMLRVPVGRLDNRKG